ncbi:hypothetical protein Ahy_A03g013204 [Arachis hypogaea]|uniref:Uncharacterized protein n=1 Tax=Arachis hypogaea TaxID=3818 RepID=A0A445DUZ4_ARAHY|nr:hypothetical protein Ahy_A03g013204 [Arachis hypogaea]
MAPADSIFNECNENLKSVLWEIRLNLKTEKSTRRTIICEEKYVNFEAGMENKNKVGSLHTWHLLIHGLKCLVYRRLICPVTK